MLTEDCTRPKSVEQFRSAQRDWCKKLNAYKSNLSRWQSLYEKKASQYNSVVSDDYAIHLGSRLPWCNPRVIGGLSSLFSCAQKDVSSTNLTNLTHTNLIFDLSPTQL